MMNKIDLRQSKYQKIEETTSNIVEDGTEIAIDVIEVGDAVTESVSEATESVAEKVTGFINGLFE